MMMNQEKDEKLRENGQVILENNKKMCIRDRDHLLSKEDGVGIVLLFSCQ